MTIDAGANGALCRLHEAVAHPDHVVGRHLPRGWPFGTERMADGAMVSHGSRPRPSARPPSHGRCEEALATRMRELNAELGSAVTATMVDDARQTPPRKLVRIESKAAMTDATAALDAGGLDHDQRGAGIGEHTEMIEVPVGCHAIVGTVLAHR